MDPSGAVLIGGVYTESQNTSSQDLFFRKLDGSSGFTLWTTTFGTHASNFFNGLTSDANGGVYATGSTTGSFPGTPGASSQSSVANDSFVLKLNGATGAKTWVSQIEQSAGSNIGPFSIAVDPSGNPVVAGAVSTEGISVGFGADANASGFVAKYSTVDGSPIWNKTFSTGKGDQLTGVAVATSGDVFVVGFTNGVFASGFSQPTEDIVLLELGTDGSNVSARQFGTGPLISGSITSEPQVTVGASGEVIVGAGTQGAYPGFANPDNMTQMFLMSFSDSSSSC